MDYYALATYISWFILIFSLLYNIPRIYHRIKHRIRPSDRYQSGDITLDNCEIDCPSYECSEFNLLKPIIIKFGFIFSSSSLLTWLLFKLFPAIPDAPNIVTVFAGILGSIAISIQLIKGFK